MLSNQSLDDVRKMGDDKMPSLEIHNMDTMDEYFVGTCTHVDESEEADACAQRRLCWLRDKYEKGLRVKVAILDGSQVGFLYVMPIEICPWGPLGQDLSAIPCLFVKRKAEGKGVGRALILKAEEEARRQGRKGIVTIGYYHDFWFMPASYFEGLGFSVAQRTGQTVILWKAFDTSAEPPRLPKRNYRFMPVTDKVVVDLFWNSFCLTSNTEAQRVREVVEEFGEVVVLNEYCADNQEILFHYQTPRGIFINGQEIWWGYAAPKEGIRKAIVKALKNK